MLCCRVGFASECEFSLSFGETWMAPVPSDPGSLKPNTRNYLEYFWEGNSCVHYIDLAVFQPRSCSVRTSSDSPAPKNSSSSTSQILAKLFFTAHQMGNSNQLKWFVQFLALCMLAIKKKNHARLYSEQNLPSEINVYQLFFWIWIASSVLMKGRASQNSQTQPGSDGAFGFYE